MVKKEFNEMKIFIDLFNEDDPFGGRDIIIDNFHIYCDRIDLCAYTLVFKKGGVIVATAYIPIIKEGLWFKDGDGKRHSLCKREWVMN